MFNFIMKEYTMRIMKHVVLVFAVIMALYPVVTAHAADNDPVTLAGILKYAKCPLTDDQVKIIDAIKPGEGMRESMRAMNEMFDEKQTKALIEKLGSMPSRGDRPERPRSLFQIIILEKEKCPLTVKQLNEMKNVTMDREGFRKMMEIYTDEQREAMQKYMGDRRGGRERRQ